MPSTTNNNDNDPALSCRPPTLSSRDTTRLPRDTTRLPSPLLPWLTSAAPDPFLSTSPCLWHGAAFKRDKGPC